MAVKKTAKKQSNRGAVVKAFAAVTKGAWDKARTVEAKSRILPYGTFYSRISKCQYGLDKNNKPFFMFHGSLMSDDDESIDNQAWTKGHFITPPKPQTADQKKDGFVPKTIEEKLEALSSDLQLIGIETDSLDMTDLFDAADQVSEDQPVIKIRIAENKGGGDPWINFIGPVDDDDPKMPSGAYDDDPEEGDDEEEEEQPKARRGKKKAAEEEIDEDDVEANDEEEEEERPVRRGKKKVVEEEEEEDDEGDEEEEEEEEAPPKRGRAKKKVVEEDDDPPEDFDEDEDEVEEDEPPKKRPGRKAPAKTTKK